VGWRARLGVGRHRVRGELSGL